MKKRHLVVIGHPNKKSFCYSHMEKVLKFGIRKAHLGPSNRPFEGPKSTFQVPHFDTLSTVKWLVIDQFSTNFGFETGYRLLSVYTTP